MQTTVKRTTLIVRNMDVSAPWYEQVLGMTRYYDDLYTLSGSGLPVGGEGDRIRLVLMQGESTEVGMIGLMQWIDPPLPAPEKIPDSVTYGNPTFVLSTDDCEEAWRRARAFGTPIYADPHDWDVTMPSGETLYFRGIALFDPDGHFFQLNQPVTGPKP